MGIVTLGTADTTPLDLANADATVAADGLYCAPLPVLPMTDASGRPVSTAEPNCRPAVSAEVARAAVDAARWPINQQSACSRSDAGTAPEVGAAFKNRPVAGKTGSTEDNATETFVATTPQLAAAGIAADPASGPTPSATGCPPASAWRWRTPYSRRFAGQPERPLRRPSHRWPATDPSSSAPVV